MKAIYIAFSLYPEISGQSIYTAAIARSLADYAELYVFAYFSKKEYKDSEEFLEFKEVHFYKYEEKINFNNFINKLKVTNCINKNMLKDIINCIVQNKIKYIVIEHIGMTSYFFYLKRRFPNIKFIYSSENAEYLNIKASLLNGVRNRRFWRIRVLLHKRQEIKVLKNANKIISISDNDTQLFINDLKIKTPIIQSHPRYKFSNIWNKIERFEKKLLIVGSMNWYPNISGTLRFVEEYFLELLKLDANYKLFIVGKNPTKEIQYLSQKYKQIYVTGFVEDIDEYYKSCDIAIIPVYEGTGIKIKLIEAAGKGIPIITTRYAAKDYKISNELFLADSKEEFINAVNSISNSSDIRSEKHSGSLALYNNIIDNKDFCTGVFC